MPYGVKAIVRVQGRNEFSMTFSRPGEKSARGGSTPSVKADVSTP